MELDGIRHDIRSKMLKDRLINLKKIQDENLKKENEKIGDKIFHK
jgi:hypothetical protein